jgi:hypothetical protein
MQVSAQTELAVSFVQEAVRPPTWRKDPLPVTYVFSAEELNDAHLLDLNVWATKRFPNPRVISPFVLDWSALFNPRFSRAVAMRDRRSRTRVPRLRCHDNLASPRELTWFWLQSYVFLAAVTMSAAIVQSRWSPGTIASKYDKLWRAAEILDEQSPHLQNDAIRKRVSALANDTSFPLVDRLIEIRALFLQVVARIATPSSTSCVTLRRGTIHRDLIDRFGFVNEIRTANAGVDAIVVYGSSITSPNFADYDVLLVCEAPERTLRRLANLAPKWRGKELNLGVYSRRELWNMQLLSGDNLQDVALCLYGEVEVPRKDNATLLARNMSFGMIRLRQQLGMISPSLTLESSDDKQNLYDYFIKIPANIVKGTLGVVGARMTKDEVETWIRERCDSMYPPGPVVNVGSYASALAKAAVRTERVLRALNQCLRIVEYPET